MRTWLGIVAVLVLAALLTVAVTSGVAAAQQQNPIPQNTWGPSWGGWDCGMMGGYYANPANSGSFRGSYGGWGMMGRNGGGNSAGWGMIRGWW
ncbi:MAG: hypothetical protein M1401_18025 [Chloroflexi bacterium]|nr:hypothetical protein [Chloroflexota bacterium]MCL5110720.1 hypothetical protein [Chloroflexota bacterium]